MRPIYEHVYILFTELMKDIHFIRKKENIDALSRYKDYLRKGKTMENLKNTFCFDYLAETSFPIYLRNLVRIPSHHHDEQRFINECRIHYQGKPESLQFLDEFKEYYTPQTSILWYTREGFLFRLLNKALRHRDINGIYLLHFFIVDLFNEISLRCSYHEKAIDFCFRGQLISMDELDMFKEQKWFCANSFISATKNYALAQMFAGCGYVLVNGIERVIFRIKIPQSSWKTGYVADISKQSYNEDEEEVLFAAGTLFRKTQVSYNDIDRIWCISLEMCSSNVSPSPYTYIQYCSINMRLLELDCLLHKEMNHTFSEPDRYGEEFRNLYKVLLKELSPTLDIIQLCCCKDSSDSYEMKFLPLYKNTNNVITNLHIMTTVYDCLGMTYYYEKFNFDLALQYFTKAAELESQAILKNEHSTQRRYFYMACLYKIKGNFMSAWAMCRVILDKLNKWDCTVMNAILYAPQYKTKSYTYSPREIKNLKLFIDYAQIDIDKYWYGILVSYQHLYNSYRGKRMLSLDLAWLCLIKSIKMLMKYKAHDFVTLLSEFHKLFVFSTDNFKESLYHVQVLFKLEEDIETLLFKSFIPSFVECFKQYLYTLSGQPEREISWFYEFIGDNYASQGLMDTAIEWWRTAYQLWNRNTRFSAHAIRCEYKTEFPEYYQDLNAGIKPPIQR